MMLLLFMLHFIALLDGFPMPSIVMMLAVMTIFIDINRRALWRGSALPMVASMGTDDTAGSPY